MKKTSIIQRLCLFLFALVLAAPAWAEDVTLQDDNGTKYVNMPKTGTNTLTLDGRVTSFKVYDNGGKDGNYSDNSNGTLVLTAPEGYIIKLSGSIKTEEEYDNLTVYDSKNIDGTKLLATLSSSRSGVQTAIPNISSTGQGMTLKFQSDGSNNYAGLDLTVTLAKLNAIYNVIVNSTMGGTVVSRNAQARPGETVSLDATPANGYGLSHLGVKDTNGNVITVEGGNWHTATATFIMPSDNVTVTPTFTDDLTAGGGLYINMPQTDSKTITIPLGVTSFKVYDDGGKDGRYSQECNGTLVLTAPAGYHLQLSGTCVAQPGSDYLSVYDGIGTSGTTLIDKVSFYDYDESTDIPNVASTAQSMTLYFYSDLGFTDSGLDLTVTLVDANATHRVSIASATGGSVTIHKEQAYVNEIVTLTASPASGYLLKDLSVTEEDGNAIAVEGGTWYNGTATFTMPDNDVTVTPTFTNDLTADGGLCINMSQTGTITAPIPVGVHSFKVYDDGGKDGNYSSNCRSTLVLTAPQYCQLQLSGHISADTNNKDWLFVYDSDNIDNGLIFSGRDVQSIDHDINLRSTGQNLTLFFRTDGSNYAGLDLTVTVLNVHTPHDITINTATGGTVVSNKPQAKADETVALTITPESGYLLSSIRVTDAGGKTIAVEGGTWYNNTTTFTMPATAVTVTPKFTNDLNSKHLYINMPKTGIVTAPIPSGVTSFKVYDDGGKDGTYDSNCDGHLVLTAPAGYTLQLSGSIDADDYDKLTVYDGDEASDVKLLNAFSSTPRFSLTNIPTIFSTGRSMTINFQTDLGIWDDGLDLTVSLVNSEAPHDITINAAEGGSIVSSTPQAKVKETVTLTATPESGFLLNGIRVTDADGNAITVEGGNWHTNTATFIMPDRGVTVTPTFTNNMTADGGLYINIPQMGSKTVSIPSGVTSFKVYDNGGKNNNYSNNCDGTLVFTAPAGYTLKLSGSITTEEDKDFLSVHDEVSGTTYKASSHPHGVPTAISTVFSKGQSMELNFQSNISNNYAGLDLTVEVVKLLTFTPTLSFDTQTQKVWALTPPVITLPADYDGKPTYSSNNEEAVRVDDEGRLMPGGNSCFGQTATININYPATAYYKAATASYTITVEADKTMPLASPDDWQNFCNLVEGTSPHDGSGNPDAKLTLDAKMTADIDLGSNIWTAGYSYAYYSGNFDGQGHTLTVNWNTANEVYPFEYLEEATIKNLHVKGQITTEQGSAAGLIGCIDGEATLSNITSEMDITSSYDGTCSLAGMVRQVQHDSNVTFNNCIVKGSITATTDGGKQGQAGFVYHQDGTCTLNNCLYIGTNTATGNSYTFAPNAQLTNCHYLHACGEAQGEKTDEFGLADGTVLAKLGSAWAQKLGEMPELYSESKKNEDNYLYYDTENSAWTCDNFSLAKHPKMPIGIDFIAARIKDSRTFAETDKTCTMCLPYDFPINGFKAYTLSGNTGTTLRFKEVEGKLEAYHPYYIVLNGLQSTDGENLLVKAYNDEALDRKEGEYTFAGTVFEMDNMSAAFDDAYILQGDNLWHKVMAGNAAVNIPAYRAYITQESESEAKTLSISFDDETTGISAIETTDLDGTVRYYDLSGRYIGTSLKGQPRGVYVGNGKKVLKK